MGELDTSKFTFKGAGYNKVFDHERLSGQAKGVYNLMSDGRWRTLSEINDELGYPEASISAQLRAFRRKEFGSHTVNRRRRGNPTGGLHEYSLVIPKKDPREDKQIEVVNLYLKEDLLKCTLVLATGFGKSNVILRILNKLRPPKILILVNSTDLKEYSWKDEFYKFGYGMIYERDVHIVTYQEAYKWTKETKNLKDWTIVADEADFASEVPEYSKFFYEFSDVRTIAITGFITESKQVWFDKHLPVLYKYAIADAQEDEVLNKMHFKLVKYELSRMKNVEVHYGPASNRQSFKTSESASYEYHEKSFISCIIKQKELEMKMYTGDISSVDYEKEARQVKYAIERAIKGRTDVLLNSTSSVQTVEKIKDLLDDDAKTVIFSVLTKQSDRLAEFTYNSNNTKEYNTENFSKFNSGKIATLGVCGKIDRGVNIHRLNTAIFESYYGSDTKATQRLGRMARLNPNEVSTIYILLPYYRYKTTDENGHDSFELRPTQQVNWCKKMLGTTLIHSHEIIDWTYDG